MVLGVHLLDIFCIPVFLCKVAYSDTAMNAIYVFVFFYLNWQTNAKTIYTRAPQKNGWFIMTVNLPQNNLICLGTVSHEALKVHLGNTMTAIRFS